MEGFTLEGQTDPLPFLPCIGRVFPGAVGGGNRTLGFGSNFPGHSVKTGLVKNSPFVEGTPYLESGRRWLKGPKPTTASSQKQAKGGRFCRFCFQRLKGCS